MYGKWTVFDAIDDTHLRYRPVTVAHVQKMYPEHNWSFARIEQAFSLLVEAERFDHVGGGSYQKRQGLQRWSTAQWRELEARLRQPRNTRQGVIQSLGLRKCEPSLPGYVYLIQAEGLAPIKIGFARDIQARLRSLQLGCPVPLMVLRAIATANMSALELRLHDRYSHYKIHSEWYALPTEVLAQLLTEEFSEKESV